MECTICIDNYDAPLRKCLRCTAYVHEFCFWTWHYMKYPILMGCPNCKPGRNELIPSNSPDIILISNGKNIPPIPCPPIPPEKIHLPPLLSASCPPYYNNQQIDEEPEGHLVIDEDSSEDQPVFHPLTAHKCFF